MATPIDCKLESDELIQAKKDAKARIKDAWRKAFEKPLKTGIMAKHIVTCTTDKEEKVELEVGFDSASIMAWKAMPVIIAEGFVYGESADITVDADTELLLSTGQLPISLLKEIQDREVSVRDYYNEYQVITFLEAVRVGYLMEKAHAGITGRKWMLERLIDDETDIEKVKAITWDTVYDDVNTYGE